MDEKKTTEGGEDPIEKRGSFPLQSFVKMLCWIPLVGILMEFYHTYRWGNYLSNRNTTYLYWAGMLWHGTFTWILMRLAF